MKLSNLLIIAAVLFAIAFMLFSKTTNPTITHNGVTVHVKDTAEYFKHLNK